MFEKYKEKHQNEYKEKYESLKEDVKRYLNPILSYFNIKKELDEGRIPDNMKKGTKDLLDLIEKDCYKNIEKLDKLLKDSH
jgi:hypothetical protein